MKYSVLWKKSADDELAEIWLADDDRKAVTGAAREIDRRLQYQPETAGESRELGQRVLIVAPLGVTFQVYERDRLVRVGNVWRFRQR